MIPNFDMSDEKIIDNRKTIEAIKNCGFPVFIWGYVLTAKLVAQKLKENGIAVEGWVTDKPDVKKEGVLSKDELIKNYSQYVLVRGFANAFKFSEDEVKTMWQGCQKSYIIADVYDSYHIEGISREYYLANKPLFDEVYDNMADDFSRNSLFAYIQAKVLKRHEPTLPYVEDTQYFFKPSLWKQSSSDVLLDCGAFDGDSIFTFVNLYGDNYKQIIACEPDPLNIEKLKKNMLARNIKNIVPLNVGVGSEKNMLRFNLQDDASSRFDNEGELTITVDTIDNIERLTGGGITIIKMDIEGFEVPALRGGEQTIIKNRPVLAICAYHKRDDVFSIYQYVKSIVPDYKFYFRCHKAMASDAVLYAIPVERCV